jgi:hypothetical protein
MASPQVLTGKVQGNALRGLLRNRLNLMACLKSNDGWPS